MDPQETKDCPLCGQSNPRVRYQFDACAIVRCRSCGLMWLFPRPLLEDLQETYGKDYFANERFMSNQNEYLYGYHDYIAERINKQFGYKKTVKKTKALLQAQPDGNKAPTWLDVGCGLGYLMDVAFDQNFEVHGIEFNAAAVAYINSKYRYPTMLGTLEDMPHERKFDVISMMDVVEHFRDPFANLRKARELIEPNGYLLLSTMDSDSLMSRFLGKRMEDFRRTEEHLYFFSRATMARVLDECGWECVAMESIGHTFQLEFLLDRLALVSPFVARFIKACIYPKWLLEANLYCNPGTKFLAYAKPKPAL
ncbi:MAG: class I SAM-dependent methyltransferase [Verrucomicrobia bacterium]|jgi:2-polyprenyl-3-methyl-5-hydroxy-6-metoxy-1,4-benzoquinol methylase|nr:class I SAM-dependent methyltransferase [Verrucomicrobiota bacterium]MBT7066092.1 class I SAM-dependent methyltransferase [Verrucomicrobiota bacterium]MBT7700302.1 class I SAM-dependent methyltransferase [Verrucomicrobiota bacterium]